MTGYIILNKKKKGSSHSTRLAESIIKNWDISGHINIRKKYADAHNRSIIR